jgi:Tol biopolymer transport system component
LLTCACGRTDLTDALADASGATSGGQTGSGGATGGGSSGGASSTGGAGGGSTECFQGETRSNDSCGLNGRGTLVETCVNGSWSTTCTDEDGCVDGASFEEPCLLDLGKVTYTCVEGAWESGPCEFDDVFLASASIDDTPGNQSSRRPSLNATGSVVAFESQATNLGPLNFANAIFIRDLTSGAVVRVDVSSTGESANREGSTLPSISWEGRYVAFESLGDNLVPNDTNGVQDVFVRDRVVDTTERVSVNSSGVQAINASFLGAISADGRFVTFASSAPNLVSGDTNGVSDIFVRDLELGTTELVSVNSSGEPAFLPSETPSISGDGRYVAFASFATNFIDGDTNGYRDVFVRDRTLGTTELVSVSYNHPVPYLASFAPKLSADGRFVAFISESTDITPADTDTLQDVYVRELETGATTRISAPAFGQQSYGHVFDCAISGDGRFVVFSSQADNLVAEDTNQVVDIFVHDRITGMTERILGSGGVQLDGASSDPAVSRDGRFVAFTSSALNVVPHDDKAAEDVFIVTTR